MNVAGNVAMSFLTLKSPTDLLTFLLIKMNPGNENFS